MNQPIAVVLAPEAARRGEGDLPAYAVPYAAEILAHAGIPFETMSPAALAEDLSGRTLLILAQDLELMPEQREGVAAYVRAGGALIACAGTSGLDALFGCETRGYLAEGYLQVPERPNAVAGGLRREIPVFGGRRLVATTGTALARIQLAPDESSDGIVARAVGKGSTLVFAFDLVTSVLHVQQGRPIVPPPPREAIGTPASSVLDVPRNRESVEVSDTDDLYYSHAGRDANGRPLYNRETLVEPYADRLRELLLRAIFDAFDRAGRVLPLLWYWPRGQASIAHMSHDTDGNRLGVGWSLFYLLRDLDLRTTWCTMPVPGYDRAFLDALKQEGHEIALHYATGNSPIRTDHRWSQADFDWQYDQLCYLARLPSITSNKNHGIAWQGRLDFYHWCQAKGIQIEQSRGDRGFTFGTCHPWFPMEDSRPGAAPIDVLAFPFLTQDLTVVCPFAFMKPWADACHAAYGVAHFLFHPSHVEDPLCESAIRRTVAYCRGLGMEWWTSKAVNDWERARRRTKITSTDGGYRVEAPTKLDAATLLFALPRGSVAPSVSIDGRVAEATAVARHGRRFAQVVTDLAGEHALSLN